MMDGLLFVLTQPLVYVPWIVLLGLLGTIWLKNSDTKIRTGLFWLISYGFACFGLLAVAYTQRQSGCGFNLADCYSEQLPEGFWVVKFLAVLLYQLWTISAVFSIVRRLLGVSDAIARKYALISLGLLSTALFGFALYLRSFNG